LVRAHHS